MCGLTVCVCVVVGGGVLCVSEVIVYIHVCVCLQHEWLTVHKLGTCSRSAHRFTLDKHESSSSLMHALAHDPTVPSRWWARRTTATRLRWRARMRRCRFSSSATLLAMRRACSPSWRCVGERAGCAGKRAMRRACSPSWRCGGERAGVRGGEQGVQGRELNSYVH